MIHQLRAFENDLPIVGILFPVPQIMIHQLPGILFLAGFSVPQIVIHLLFFLRNIMAVLQEIFFSFPQTNCDPPTAGVPHIIIHQLIRH